MARSVLPQSIRKHLRREKARIRAQSSDSPEEKKEAEAKIQELVQKTFVQYNMNRKIEVRK